MTWTNEMSTFNKYMFRMSGAFIKWTYKSYRNNIVSWQEVIKNTEKKINKYFRSMFLILDNLMNFNKTNKIDQ